MQQTDRLCGQTGFSGDPWQDVTRGQEQGVPVTHREMFLGRKHKYILPGEGEEGKTTPLVHVLV